MKSLISFLILLVGCSNLYGLQVQTNVSPKQLDLGQSFNFQILVTDGKLKENPQIPKGPYTVEGPRHSSSTSLSIMFGKRSQTESNTYTWLITPTRGGTITIPPFTIKTSDGAQYTTREVRAKVRTPEGDPLFFIELSNPGKNLYPEQEFNITLTIYAARLKGEYKNEDPFPINRRSGEPVWPDLTIPWLSGDKGFKTTDYKTYLQSLNPKNNGKGFTINNISVRGDFDIFNFNFNSFNNTMAKFPLPRKYITRKGPDGITRDYFAYTLDRQFTAKEFGEYHFSPVVAKNYIMYNVGDNIKSREIYTVSNSLTVRVIPPPEEKRPPFYTGGIGRFRIFTKASPTKVHIGDPISLELHINGKGSLADIAPLMLSKQKGFDGFKVYDDPKVGDVKKQGSTEKIYIYRIRLKGKGIERIPPVTFSFFDPEKEQYKTIYSDPIPLTVEKTEGLEKPSIISNNSKALKKPEGHKLESTQQGIQADHSGLSALTAQHRFKPFNSILIFLGLLPPLLYGFVAGILTWYRRINANPLKQRLRGAFAKAKANLHEAHKSLRAQKPAQFYPPLGDTLNGFISDRLGLPQHGVTNQEIRSRLEKKQVSDEDISLIQEIIERCEAAKFSTINANKEAMAKDYKTVLNLLMKLRKAI